MLNAARQQQLHARLHRTPSDHSVLSSLPVLFFGDLFSAQLATIGLNPSRREYLDTHGIELDGTTRRFETLRSLGAVDRGMLEDEQCSRAIERMRCYFQPGKPVFDRWFKRLMCVVGAMGFSYRAGQVAHLDLVQEATDPTWSELRSIAREEAEELLRRDLPFLRFELEVFQVKTVVCNGRTPFHHVCELMDECRVTTGEFRGRRWYAGLGTLGQHDIYLAGWNKPLTRPPGLGEAELVELGTTLKGKLAELGCQF